MAMQPRIRKGHMRKGISRKLLEPEKGPRRRMSEREIREEFVRRAMRMGIGSKRALRRFALETGERGRFARTRENVRTVDRIEGELHEKGQFPEKPLKHAKIERLIEEGLGNEEIATLVGVKPDTIRIYKQRHGITNFFPGLKSPIMVVVRTLVRYDALLEIANKPAELGRFEKLKRADAMKTASSELNSDDFYHWFKFNPEIMKTARNLGKGKYWRKALRQLRGWILEQEELYGREYAGLPSRLRRTAKGDRARRLLIEGRLSSQEIARRTGLGRVNVGMIKYRMEKERNVKLLIPGTSLPPARAALVWAKFEILRQLSDAEGWSRSRCESVAEAGTGINMRVWRRSNPRMLEDAKEAGNGYYYAQALDRLEKDGWIAEWEERLGKKYVYDKWFAPKTRDTNGRRNLLLRKALGEVLELMPGRQLK